MKTLINLNKNFSLSGPDSLQAIRQFNEMDRLGRIPQTKQQEQMMTDRDYMQWMYNNGVPFAFIDAIKESIGTVTVWANREEIQDLSDDEHKLKDWVWKLDDLSGANLRKIEGLIELPEGAKEDYKGFKVEICMPKSKYSNYFSVKELCSLFEFEDRIKCVTDEENVAKIEEIELALEEDKHLAERIKKCGLRRIASSDKTSVFRIEGDVGYNDKWGLYTPIGNSRVSIVVFDRETLDFSIIIESDLNFDLKAKKGKEGKAIISNTDHCELCQDSESRPYKQFLELCEFAPMTNVMTMSASKNEVTKQ